MLWQSIPWSSMTWALPRLPSIILTMDFLNLSVNLCFVGSHSGQKMLMRTITATVRDAKDPSLHYDVSDIFRNDIVDGGMKFWIVGDWFDLHIKNKRHATNIRFQDLVKMFPDFVNVAREDVLPLLTSNEGARSSKGDQTQVQEQGPGNEDTQPEVQAQPDAQAQQSATDVADAEPTVDQLSEEVGKLSSPASSDSSVRNEPDEVDIEPRKTGENTDEKPNKFEKWSASLKSVHDNSWTEGNKREVVIKMVSYGSAAKLRNLDADIYADLPGEIDLTTADVLCYFPGYLQDPFFRCRCILAGWEPHSLFNLLVQCRPLDDLPSTRSLAGQIKGTMRKLTGDESFRLSVYHAKVEREDRPQFLDYSADAFAMTRLMKTDGSRVADVFQYRIHDLSLAELLKYSDNKAPIASDMGTLSKLVEAAFNGEIDCNLTMSNVSAFVAKTENQKFVVHWDHDKDVASAVRWRCTPRDQSVRQLDH